ncbi:MAG: MFS transporter [Planctomycetota bacterium]
MLVRFSLYGFLKNQRYFEPFLVLALLARDLSFFEIGTLVTLREAAVHLLEIPSGAVADRFGRSRAMMLSFAAYIGSFLLFARASAYGGIALAMLLFAVGEAFRTGTHKAIIFAWLRQQGRENERTRVYGFTRSWSKLGSATSALLASGFVLATASYVDVFYFAILPYTACLVSFATYPAALDRADRARLPAGGIWRSAATAVTRAVREPRVRRLMFEAMAFEGVFKTVKDYLQPVLLLAATAWAARGGLGEGLAVEQRAAIVTGPVYFVLFLAAALASRRAQALVQRCGSEAAASRWLWRADAVAFAVVTGAAALGSAVGAILGFMLLHVLQNLWRPILIGRIDAASDSSLGATTLSIESQAQRVTTMVLAPVLGALVDGLGDGMTRFWPVGAVGFVAAVAACWATRSRS